MRTRISFYDPLYDFVTFEEASNLRPRAFLDAGFANVGAERHGDSISPTRDEKVILPFLAAPEFNRLNFVRQSDLAFLVYPSATHTRFAHAIGACYLGFVAAQRVAVAELNKTTRQLEGEPKYLAEFLEDAGLREEFYAALLLHDIGHFPFSHTLEGNEDLWEGLGTRFQHEDVACQLIEGSGAFFDAWTRVIAELRGRDADEFPRIHEVFGKVQGIDRGAVCYLIGGREVFLEGRGTRQEAELRVVHELVSGLLDLDRIDHYRRDSYFTGLKTGSGLNFASLLAGLTVAYVPSSPESPAELRLSPTAVGHAISLLQSKERLYEDCFDQPDNVAYECMLHQAVNMTVFGDDFYDATDRRELSAARQREVLDLLVLSDDELLSRLASQGGPSVASLVFRIRNRSPFRAVTRLLFPSDAVPTLPRIRDVTVECSGVRGTGVSLLASRGFSRGNLRLHSSEWLDLQRLRNIAGERLADGRYRRQIEHFKEAQESTFDVLWIFGSGDEEVEKLAAAMPEVCRRLSCREEGLK